MKAIVAHHDISGPAHSLEAIPRGAHRRCGDQDPRYVGRPTAQDRMSSRKVATPERDPDQPVDVISFRMRRATEPVCGGLRQTPDDLKDLVSLRNTLVHHFIDQHDLWTVDGCRAAQDALTTAAYAHRSTLRATAGMGRAHGSGAAPDGGVRPVGCVSTIGGQWHRAGRHGGLAGRRRRSRTARGRQNWPSRVGRPSQPPDAGSPSGIRSSCLPNTDAAVGGRWYESRLFELRLPRRGWAARPWFKARGIALRGCHDAVSPAAHALLCFRAIPRG